MRFSCVREEAAYLDGGCELVRRPSGSLISSFRLTSHDDHVLTLNQFFVFFTSFNRIERLELFSQLRVATRGATHCLFASLFFSSHCSSTSVMLFVLRCLICFCNAAHPQTQICRTRKYLEVHISLTPTSSQYEGTPNPAYGIYIYICMYTYIYIYMYIYT